MKAETVDHQNRSARAGRSRRDLLCCGTGRSWSRQRVGPRIGLLLVLFCGALECGQSPCAGDDQSGNGTGAPTGETHTSEKLLVTSLLKETLQEDDWFFYTPLKDTKLADTWDIVQDGEGPILVCTGAPYGYLRTTQQYDDFEMELEWRFPQDENGNSGILLYTSEEDKVWPDSIQVQLHQPVAGSIFPSADARSDNEIRDVRNVARPINEWNTCRISSRGGTIIVDINGKKIGEVTGCRPSRGAIALQSEGSEVHFRRIRIRETPPVVAPQPATDASTSWLPHRMKSWGPGGDDRCLDIEPCRPIDTASMPTRRTCRRDRRVRKVFHVAHREPLAADCDPCCGGDRVRLDVAGPAELLVADGGDRLSRFEWRSPGF